MKTLLTVVLFLALTVGAFANGIMLNGVGARANAMGNAYTAVTDDVQALYWNPAGLTEIQGKQAMGSFVGVWPKATYTDPTGVVDIKSSNSLYPFGGAGFAMGGLLDGKLAFGLNVHVPAGLGVEYDEADVALLVPGSEINWKAKIGMIEVAPGIAYTPHPMISIGAAFYLDYVLMNMWRTMDMGPFGTGSYTEESTGIGYSGVFGIKVKPAPIVAFGFAFKPKRTVTMSGDAALPQLAGMNASTTSAFDRDVAWPMEIRGGGAVTLPMIPLTFAADARYIFWEKACDEFVAVYEDTGWNERMTTPDTNGTRGDTMYLHWEDRLGFNVGTEYKINPLIAVRAGYYYDPAPGPDTTHSILVPNNDLNAFTGGVGISVNIVKIDLGFEYVMSSDREIPIDDDSDHEMAGTHGLTILSPSAAVTINF